MREVCRYFLWNFSIRATLLIFGFPFLLNTRYTVSTGLYVLNSTETIVIHTILFIIFALIMRYATSFASDMLSYLIA